MLKMIGSQKAAVAVIISMSALIGKINIF